MSSKRKNVKPVEPAKVGGNDSNLSLFWNSTLFNETYLRNDLAIFHKDVWEQQELEFSVFLNKFENFARNLENENLSTWSERTTINRVIKPILNMLGYVSASNENIEPWIEDEPFSFQERDGVKTYKPDFVIVNDHTELRYILEKKGFEKLEEARSEGVILPIEAKYWNRIEEYRLNRKEDVSKADKKDNLESARSMDFDDQCLKYMEILNKPYGILTDGSVWRIYNLSLSTESYKPYFQFNLGKMIRHIQRSDFLSSNEDKNLFETEVKYFYFLFRKKSIFPADGSEPFLDELLSYSKKYVDDVKEDLKVRFLNAMSIACNGLKRYYPNLEKNETLEQIRNLAESHIFNILFLRYCEARGILPMRQDPEGYRLISISHTLDKLEGFDPKREKDNLNALFLKRSFNDFDYKPEGHELYDRLIKLTNVVQKGNKFQGFVIKGFNQSVFSSEEVELIEKFKLTNREMIKMLFELGFSKSDIPNRKFQQIPYSSFSPRQLGSIYESFLEFKLDFAKTDMAFIKKQWVAANLSSEKMKDMEVPKVKKGDLFFTPNNKDRKVSGSYYTEDDLVQYIVEKTLSNLTKGKGTKEILKIKVCDPAMGSGHFLSAALSFLSKSYLKALGDETHDDLSVSLTSIKKVILHNCIFGCDINPRAVKLAKMSLWLESADPQDQLEDLEGQLIVINSILLANSNLCNPKLKNTDFLSAYNNGFDALLTNPPWEGLKVNEDEFFNPYLNDVNKKTKRKDKIKEREELLKRRPEIKREFDAYVESINKIRSVVTQNFKYQKTEIDGFSTAMSEDNLYKIFTEISLMITKKDGYVGIIVPSGILSDIGTSKLRENIFKNYKIETILAFNKDAQVFENVTQSCSLLVIKNSEPEQDCEMLFEIDSIKTFNEQKYLLNKVDMSVFSSVSDKTLPIFEIRDKVEQSCIRKIVNHKKIYELENDNNSIKPKCGSNTTYISELLSDRKTNNPIAKGEDIQRYFYKKVSGGYLSPSLLKDKKRVDIGSKVAIGMISGTTDIRRMRVAIIPDGAWPVNSINYLESNVSEEEKYFWVALYNSTSIEYLIRKICQNNNINIYALKHLPVIRYDKNDVDHKKIVSLSKQLERNFSKSIEGNLDQLIANLFSLTKAEYNYILNRYFSGYFDS